MVLGVLFHGSSNSAIRVTLSQYGVDCTAKHRRVAAANFPLGVILWLIRIVGNIVTL